MDKMVPILGGKIMTLRQYYIIHAPRPYKSEIKDLAIELQITDKFKLEAIFRARYADALIGVENA